MNQILEKSLVWEPVNKGTNHSYNFWRLSRVDLERSALRAVYLASSEVRRHLQLCIQLELDFSQIP